MQRNELALCLSDSVGL